ncbi:hypothetical protein WJX75_003443 [Coccomyxa subellipsoidea]|uniref:EF-hand domain-containing protein n=1 Tax=Coccomyxa subellipsoidea TaxID=248742 RepID=A0ABR2YP71_9CHLO
MGNSSSSGFQDGVMSKKDMERMQRRFSRLANGRQDRAEFAFQLYDKDGDGFVSPKELLAMLRKIMSHALSEKALEQIVAATVAEHDKDGDGLLSRSEFKNLLAASSEAQTSISVG